MGRQLIASVLYLINEVGLSMYRFLSLGAKKTKKQPQSVELGVNRSLTIRTFNALASYCCLNRRSTENEGTLTEKGKLLEERVFLTLLNQTRAVDQPVSRPVEPIGLCLNRLSLLAPKTYIFLIFFSFLILRQSL